MATELSVPENNGGFVAWYIPGTSGVWDDPVCHREFGAAYNEFSRTTLRDRISCWTLMDKDYFFLLFESK